MKKDLVFLDINASSHNKEKEKLQNNRALTIEK